MDRAVGSNRVRPWTQDPMTVRRRRDKVTIAMPAMDTYRQQMEDVQRQYERLRLTEPSRRPLTWRTFASDSLTALHRLPAMTRSYTFAADSEYTSISSLPTPSPVRSYGDVFYGNGHAQDSPEQWSMPRDEMSGNGRGVRHDPYPLEPAQNDHHEQVIQIVSDRVPPLVLSCPHPNRPLAFSYPLSSDQTENVRYVSRKFGWMSSSPPSPKAKKSEVVKRKEEDEVSSSGVSSEEDDMENKAKGRQVHLTADSTRNDPNRNSFQRDSIDILQLCEHLKTRGLGDPVLSTHSHTGRRSSSLPPGVKARCLPRDPSTREKIKGRARLDYELANMRAVAFCEQQQSRVFRTASADLRDRDVRMLEEEERENVQRDLNNAEEDPDHQRYMAEDDDDDSSLVGSPLSREELFLRIEAWADDVDKAFHRGQS